MKKHQSLLSRKSQKAAQHDFTDKDEYDEKLLKAQKSLVGLQQRLHKKGRKVILLFEGPDAAGKGGVIKKITQYLDPRGVRVQSIGAPNVIEKNQNYMERFFRVLPEPGMITIFDRSWYGRVLVERVEKFAEPAAWKRAYSEINAIEKMLSDDGILVLKYFLDLTYEEQEKRFEEREDDPMKAWKLTDEDWRNRRKWNDYFKAFADMIEKTSTEDCPWAVVAADSKWSARVRILQDIESHMRRFV